MSSFASRPRQFVTCSTVTLLGLMALGPASCKSRSDLGTASVAPAAPAPSLVVEQVVPAPPDVAVPPSDAEKTPSGLSTKVLQPGIGEDHPRDGDVLVHVFDEDSRTYYSLEDLWADAPKVDWTR